MRCARTGKEKHTHAWQAQRALKRVGDAGLGVYFCQACRGWHLGHEKSRAADRITQLLDQTKKSLMAAMIVCTPATFSVTAAPGAVICSLGVTATDAPDGLTLTGPNAAQFALIGTPTGYDLVIGPGGIANTTASPLTEAIKIELLP